MNSVNYKDSIFFLRIQFSFFISEFPSVGPPECYQHLARINKAFMNIPCGRQTSKIIFNGPIPALV